MEIISKKNRRPVIITGFFLILSLTFTFLILRGIDPSQLISTHILLLTLVNVNIILVVVLLLLLSRNLIKLFFEKGEKWIGFKSKLIAAFIGLSFIPCALLFVVASGLLTSSIENWFSIQVERSLDSSLEVAQNFYAQAQETTKHASKQIGKDFSGPGFFESNPVRLISLLQEKQSEYGVEAVHLITSEKTFIASTWSKEKWAAGIAFPIPPDFFERILDAEEPMTTILGSVPGDLIRAVLPIRSSKEQGRGVKAILVIDRLIPSDLVEKMDLIKRESEEYEQLRRFKKPIKDSYLLSFFIVVLLILFSATWFGFYLARGITVPIQKLVDGTTAVAQGNLDFQIDLKAKDELGMLVTSFNKMTQDLKHSREELVRAQKIATWQEVALQMAHEIKNPLTPIQLSTERLRKKYEEDSPDFDRIFDESTRVIINEVQGLANLVNEFSNFARLPTPCLVLQKIEPILQEVILLYQSGHKEMTFQSRLDENTPLLRLDRDQIKRVFVNLFENAVEAMRLNGQGPDIGDNPIHRGRIFLSTRYDKQAERARISVEDEGMGVAPEDMDKLFLPSFSRKKGGSGLGLAIVHRIVLDHGGHISVVPREPKGTTFMIELPVVV